VELAEELVARGVTEAQSLLDDFFGEAARYGLDSTEEVVWVDGFYLDRYPVTNRKYELMVPGHQRLRDQCSDTDDQPVVWVNWHEACLFCRWRGPGFRLPTEVEWDRAAYWDPVRGVERDYPWGDEFDPARCNTSEGGPGKTTPVGAYPEGVSAYGCFDMAGNVSEWTESPRSDQQGWREYRGGSWVKDHGVAARHSCSLTLTYHRGHLVGFRCAKT
jgi:formylglycine-generating enzyme required for sulfatase activity